MINFEKDRGAAKYGGFALGASSCVMKSFFFQQSQKGASSGVGGGKPTEVYFDSPMGIHYVAWL